MHPEPKTWSSCHHLPSACYASKRKRDVSSALFHMHPWCLSQFYTQQFFMSLYFDVTNLQNMRCVTEDVHSYDDLRYQAHSACFPLLNYTTFSAEVLPAFSSLTERWIRPAQLWSHSNINQKLFNGPTEGRLLQVSCERSEIAEWTQRGITAISSCEIKSFVLFVIFQELKRVFTQDCKE